MTKLNLLTDIELNAIEIFISKHQGQDIELFFGNSEPVFLKLEEVNILPLNDCTDDNYFKDNYFKDNYFKDNYFQEICEKFNITMKNKREDNGRVFLVARNKKSEAFSN
jgi:hypothetical protein